MRAPRARYAVLTGLLAAMLGAGATGADDRAHQSPVDPDPGFLEFLGSIDRLAEVTPDYLAHADRKRVARLSVKGRSPSAPPPPAAPAPGLQGGKNNE